MNESELQEQVRQLKTELEDAVSKAEEVKKATGDPAKLSKRLAEANALVEIIRSRLNDAEDMAYSFIIAELHGKLDAREESISILEREKDETAQASIEWLVANYGEKVASLVRQPSKRNFLDDVNATHRYSIPEKELEDQIIAEGEIAKQIRTEMRKIENERGAK